MKHQNSQEDPIRPHTYDGIQEYDKRLPNWWLFTLYGTIIFSVGYWLYFHKTDLGPDQREEFRISMASLEEAQAAAAPNAVTDESLWAMSLDEASVASGKQIYATTCAACHGPELQGAIGVNLIDSEWVHGSDPLQIRKTVSEGVAVKGMPGWGAILGEERVSEVTAFILSHHKQ